MSNMSILDFFKLPLKAVQNRYSLEGNYNLYERAYQELESNDFDKGIWGKSITITDGDEAKAKSKYIELRVAELSKEEYAQKKSEATKRALEGKQFYEELNYDKLAEIVNKASKVWVYMAMFYLLWGIFFFIFFIGGLILSQETDVYFFLGSLLSMPYILGLIVKNVNTSQTLKSVRQNVTANLTIMFIASTLIFLTSQPLEPFVGAVTALISLYWILKIAFKFYYLPKTTKTTSV